MVLKQNFCGIIQLLVVLRNYHLSPTNLNLFFNYIKVGKTFTMFHCLFPVPTHFFDMFLFNREHKIIIFLATSTCILSMFCALILGVLDKRAERILRRNEEVTGDVVRLTDVKDFKATFWLVTLICVTYYVAIFPFIFLAQ